MTIKNYITQNQNGLKNADMIIVRENGHDVVYSTSQFGQGLIIKRFGNKQLKDIRITLNKQIYLEV